MVCTPIETTRLYNVSFVTYAIVDKTRHIKLNWNSNIKGAVTMGIFKPANIRSRNHLNTDCSRGKRSVHDRSNANRKTEHVKLQNKSCVSALYPTHIKMRNFWFESLHFCCVLHVSLFCYHLESSWEVFADNSTSLMQTINNHRILLAIRPRPVWLQAYSLGCIVTCSK